MAQFEPYLIFDGNCAEAMRFYERTLGGKIEMMMNHADSPMGAQMPPGSANAERILHARLTLEGRALMASDSMAGQPYQGMHGFSISMSYPTVAEGRRVFDALAAGGRVDMPMQDTFWVESFGMLVDKFGTAWMVSAGKSKL
jgi:PhnB protein